MINSCSSGDEVKKTRSTKYSSNLVLPPLGKPTSPRNGLSLQGKLSTVQHGLSGQRVLAPRRYDQRRAKTSGIISAKRRIQIKERNHHGVEMDEYSKSPQHQIPSTPKLQRKVVKHNDSASFVKTSCQLERRGRRLSEERRTRVQMISLSESSEHSMTENALPLEWEDRITDRSEASNSTQKSGSAPSSTRRESPPLTKSFLYPVKPMTADPATGLPGIVRIEDYQHMALRNKKEINLQQLYDTSYRPTMKFPKFNSATLTTFNPQFINNNCAQRRNDSSAMVGGSILWEC